ncbi:MAG: portal protein, partial [Fusobacteriaceae bacterium]
NGYSNILFETEMSYNPFIVTRSLKGGGSIYGVGVALKVLPNIINLNNSKYLKRVYGKLGIKPPLAFEGDNKHMNNIELEMGSMFYLGQRGQNSISPLNLSSSVNMELMNIEDDKMQIRDGMFSSYISNMDSLGQQPRTA